MGLLNVNEPEAMPLNDTQPMFAFVPETPLDVLLATPLDPLLMAPMNFYQSMYPLAPHTDLDLAPVQPPQSSSLTTDETHSFLSQLQTIPHLQQNVPQLPASTLNFQLDFSPFTFQTDFSTESLQTERPSMFVSSIPLVAMSLASTPACMSEPVSPVESIESIFSDLYREPATEKAVKKHKCDHCEKCFPSNARLQSHILIHTGERPFKCDLCDASYTTNNRLTVHKRSHTDERPYHCDQPGCGYSAKQSCSLKSHKRSHLTREEKRMDRFLNKKAVPCPTCKRKYKTEESRDTHIRLHHSS
ncbi:hypothetical protein BC830DRAFT_1139530 [Chytriomyces sp. MP71]|nr:hypothetical protein BC830DRAFT_1139530 [Chytriomyces sp. MP71]